MRSIHHVNFYVTDASYWCQWFANYFGFQHQATYKTASTLTMILKQGQVQFRVSEALCSNSPVAEYLENHPQGVGEIALAVTEKKPDLLPPWGDLNHRFEPVLTSNQDSQTDFIAIDHVVVNVAKIADAASWYHENLDLDWGDRFTIQTNYSALRSVVMQSGQVQIPLNEPGSATSQIQVFLDHNRGAGVQHLALLTANIENTVARLRQRGVEFLETTPPILVESQNQGRSQLKQIFTKPIFPEPTFFLEIIERHNAAQGFGERNFQSLFEAVEQQQLSQFAKMHK